MALAKFSKFKKERAVIKEARSKETKIKKFNKLFNEQLGKLGVSSVADLSEDQVNKLLSSLASEPVNEDRMREIEKDGIIAGTPKDAGTEGEVAKKHTFDSPQTPDAEAEADAEDMKAEESEEVDEAKKSVKEGDLEDEDDAEKAAHHKDAAKDDYAQVAALKKDAADDKEAEDHYKDAAKDDYAQVADLKKDAHDDKESEDEEDAKESVKEAEVVEADEIKSDKEFDDYADTLLKKAHPDDFDEATAKKVKDGLKKKYDGDYGAMVGALSSNFGG